ncbi:MOSC domain-containing protein [Roseivivax isoporae]|uniref:Sulfurase n=1 Tax=Roseivivax isoporae LMG 25204 TaxID=1449351 RepID=X7F6B1_9RHOB|nr:MOSC domain-containing protein [Roseivivax isoporae]ETX28447.1 sulfurase [Roseivivax isoporae LMG 25204]
MSALHDMMTRVAQPGRIDWIGLRQVRLAEVAAVAAARIGTDGLEGDHGRAGKRAVTLMQAEHLAPIGAYLGQGPVAAEVLRRNLLVSGVNLSALRGRVLRAGGAVLRVTGPCAPCSRMEAALGPGGYAAMRGHGGWCAEVVAPGAVRVGDAVVPE